MNRRNFLSALALIPGLGWLSNHRGILILLGMSVYLALALACSIRFSHKFESENKAFREKCESLGGLVVHGFAMRDCRFPPK